MASTNKLTGFGSGFAQKEDEKLQQQNAAGFAGSGTGITSKAPTLGQFAQANQSRAADVAKMVSNRAGQQGVGNSQAVYEGGQRIDDQSKNRQTMGNQYGQGESKVDAAVLANSGQKISPNTQAFNAAATAKPRQGLFSFGAKATQDPTALLAGIQRSTNLSTVAKTPEQQALYQKEIADTKNAYANSVAKQGAIEDADKVNAAIQGGDFGTLMTALRRGYTGEGALTDDALLKQGKDQLASKQAGIDATAQAYKGAADTSVAKANAEAAAAAQAAADKAAQDKAKAEVLKAYKKGKYSTLTGPTSPTNNPAKIKGFVEDLKAAGYTDEEIKKLKKERGIMI